MVTITTTAKKYLDKITSQHGTNYVRLSVDGGGCSGFQYKWDFSEVAIETDNVIEIKDGCALLVDQSSEMYLIGSTVDYIEELGGSYLQVQNPMVKSACGCGESFNIDPSKIEVGDPFA